MQHSDPDVPRGYQLPLMLADILVCLHIISSNHPRFATSRTAASLLNIPCPRQKICWAAETLRNKRMYTLGSHLFDFKWFLEGNITQGSRLTCVLGEQGDGGPTEYVVASEECCW